MPTAIVAFTPEQIARVCHDANRALQAVLADPAIPVAPPWDAAPDLHRTSMVATVRGILLDDWTPEQAHQDWLRTKVANGWIWGPVKDEDARTHPLLVPYADLPEQAKMKDHLFVAIVRTLIP